MLSIMYMHIILKNPKHVTGHPYTCAIWWRIFETWGVAGMKAGCVCGSCLWWCLGIILSRLVYGLDDIKYMIPWWGWIHGNRMKIRRCNHWLQVLPWSWVQKCCSPETIRDLHRCIQAGYNRIDGDIRVSIHLKSLEYSTVVSPSRMQLLPPCLKTCFSSSGSKLGSSSSPALVWFKENIVFHVDSIIACCWWMCECEREFETMHTFVPSKQHGHNLPDGTIRANSDCQCSSTRKWREALTNIFKQHRKPKLDCILQCPHVLATLRELDHLCIQRKEWQKGAVHTAKGYVHTKRGVTKWT